MSTADMSRNLSQTGIQCDGGSDARQQRWSLASPYTYDDVVGGFRAIVSAQDPTPTAHTGLQPLALCMLAFPVLVLCYLVFLAFLVGIGIDGVRLGTSTGYPMLTSSAIILFASAVVILMRMIYRIMADWRRRYINVRLNTDDHAVFFTFVAKVADAVKGPVPGIITVDNEVGLLIRQRGVQRGINETELVIGLPLLYSLSARQLSGLIAHAYGGFSRSDGHFGYPLIANINRWLVRMSEGDASRQYDASHWKFTVGLMQPVDWWLSSFFLAMSRLANAMSFSAMRHIDLLGDLYSARMAGATEFRATQLRLRSLQLGKARLIERINAGDVPEDNNLAKLIAQESDNICHFMRPLLINEMEDLASPFSRSRVVDLGRILEVEKGQDEGACFLLGPSSKLLLNVDSIGRQIGAKYLGAQDRGL